MVKYNKLVLLLILYVFITHSEGVPVLEDKGIDNKITNQKHDLELNNVEGYLEQRKNIMEKYYARLKERNEGRIQFTTESADKVTSTTMQSTTGSNYFNYVTTEKSANTNKTVIFGICESDSVKIIKVTTNINGGSSSGNSIEYSLKGACIACIKVEKSGDMKVTEKSGGRGSSNVHLEFDNPNTFDNYHVVINVMGKYGEC